MLAVRCPVFYQKHSEQIENSKEMQIDIKVRNQRLGRQGKWDREEREGEERTDRQRETETIQWKKEIAITNIFSL